MDSERALRSTLVTMLATTAFMGWTASSVHAGDEPGASVHQRTWTVDAVSWVSHQSVWKTRAKQRARVMRPAGRNKGIALNLIVRRAWSIEQFRCLDSLWTRESNWNHRAHNRSSGAYGIPQALPAGKMSGVASDWRSNPATQIRWGLRYIEGRYGNPCGAWGHFRSHNWY